MKDKPFEITGITYKTTKTRQVKPQTVVFKHFEITTTRPTTFMDELERLCKKFAVDRKQWFFEWR